MKQITIIIPTIAGRQDSLAQVLKGLEAQTAGTGAFDVILIQDGPGLPPPPSTLLPLRVLSHDRNRGLAAARNTAIDAVQTELAMFIDDDIIPDPGVVAAHLAFHERHRDPMVMGAGRVTWEGHPRYNGLMDWTEHRGDWALFRSLAPDQCFPYWVGGFTSFHARVIRELRFDETFTRYACEDHELGYRFFRKGGRLRFVDQAAGLHLKYVTGTSLYREMRQGTWSKWQLFQDYPDIVGGPTALISAIQMERQAAAPDLIIEMLDQFSTGVHNRMTLSTEALIRFLSGLAHCHGLLDFWRARYPGFEAAGHHLYDGFVTGSAPLHETLEAALEACPSMPWIRLHASRHTPDPHLRLARLEQILEAYPSYGMVFLERLGLLQDRERVTRDIDLWATAHLENMERSNQQGMHLALGRVLARHGWEEDALERFTLAAHFECWDEGQLVCSRQAWRELALIHERQGDGQGAAACRERQFETPPQAVAALRERLDLCGPHEPLLSGHLRQCLGLLGEPKDI